MKATNNLSQGSMREGEYAENNCVSLSSDKTCVDILPRVSFASLLNPRL